ncbi:hypothetical protein JCM17823_01880 [Halorubrum gandharaense]
MAPERVVRVAGVASLGLLAALLLYVPTHEAWASVGNGGIGLSLVLIGVIPVAVAVALIGTAGYLWRRDVLTRHITAAAMWAWGAVAFSWLMHEYVSVAQTIGGGAVDHQVNMTTTVATWSVIGLAVGLARSFRTEQQEEIAAERDRFSSLFENTSDAVLEVTTERSTRGADDDDARVEDDGARTDGGLNLRVLDVNSTYDLTFEREPETVLREAVPAEDGDYEYETLCRRVARGDRYGAEIHVRTTPRQGDDRCFMLRTVDTAADRSFITLTDITDQKERQQLLEERERELERMKSEREAELEERTTQLEFLHSLLRHDVQNGMMVINSRAEFLADRVDDDVAEYAETIAGRSDDIAGKIDRMRAAIAAITGEGAQKEVVDLSSVLNDRVAALVTSEPDVEVETAVDEGLRIRANDLIDDVFENVLRNAINHNDADHPRMRISAGRENGTVRVRIADNGPGISPEKRDAVFRRGVTSAAEGHGGSGFGLFFVDTMVDAYDGVVRIEDAEEGGAAFIFEFPAAEE